VDDQSKPPLADDPKFLASLGDLDAGLNEPRAHRPPAAPVRQMPPRTAAPPSPSLPPPAPPPRQGERPRALLDHFPPNAPAPATQSPAQPPRTRTAGSSPKNAGSYESFYGLNEAPFSLSTDPKFLYHSTAHGNVAQDFLSAIRRRDPVVVITGEPGVGKTLLCRAVLDQLDRRTLTSCVADPRVPLEEIFKTLLVDFGVISSADLSSGRLARASRADLTSALREFLASLAALQAFAVIVMDDAHELAPEVLEALQALSDSERETRLLQIALIGQPELQDVLKRGPGRQLAQRATVRVSLTPLEADEVVGYVLHRLAVAGTNARVEFEDAALARLHMLSRGIPRAINLLCDRVLLIGFEASASVVDQAMVNRAAEELEITPPESPALRALRAAATIGVLVLLVLVGASAAALVFEDRVLATFSQWDVPPPAPRHPPLKKPAPFDPTPPLKF
jgi:general secretion pathway protein A